MATPPFKSFLATMPTRRLDLDSDTIFVDFTQTYTFDLDQEDIDPEFWRVFSDGVRFGDHRFLPCRPKYELRRVEDDLAVQYEEEKPHIDPQASLRQTLETFRYMPGWSFSLDGPIMSPRGNLLIRVETTDSRNGEPTVITHRIAMPAGDSTAYFWMDWLNAQIAKVHDHERAEFFEVNGIKPYFPPHPTIWNGNVGDPYNVSRKI